MSERDPTKAERDHRHREGIAARLDAIRAEQSAQAERDARIERQLAEISVRLENERRPETRR